MSKASNTPAPKDGSKAQRTRELILHAAIDEFAQIGCQRATTSGIAKRAGISKGLIFYHYESKEALLIAVLEYGVDFFERNFLANHEFTATTDIFERIRLLGRMKYAFYKEYYALNAVMIDAYKLPNIPEHANIRAYFQQTIARKTPMLFAGVDTSKFRTLLPPDQMTALTIDVLAFISERYIHPHLGETASLDELSAALDKMDTYIDIIKNGVYDKMV